MGNNPNCAVDGTDYGSAVCGASTTYATTIESAQSMIYMVLPVIISLFIGVWLGKTQARQQRSYIVIVVSWLTSVVSMSKVLFKLLVGKSTNKDGKKKADVLVPQSNGTGTELKKNYVDTPVESGCDMEHVPKHIAIIMDGNRRYGKRIYGQGTLGHFDGSQKLLQVIEWLDTEGCKALTLYAFSTENWNRESFEVDTLMGLFQQFVEDDLRPIIFNRKVRMKHICSEAGNMPPKLQAAINDLERESNLNATPDSLTLNVCLSYGSRGEILNACKEIAKGCVTGTLNPDTLTEDSISERLLTAHCPDPDILIRTSGEERISNFLLWQLSYAELFFLEKDWPELEKEDFLKVIRTFAKGRQRRFGK
jgi:undecaprenyl diphosphate synthase